jgi:hypothetical protein
VGDIEKFWVVSGIEKSNGFTCEKDLNLNPDGAHCEITGRYLKVFSGGLRKLRRVYQAVRRKGTMNVELAGIGQLGDILSTRRP